MPHAAAAALETADSLSQEGHYLLGRAYQARLQHDRAAHAFEQADTTNTRVLAAWGRSLDRLGRSGQALQRYRTAYRRDSTDVTIATALASLYAQAGAWHRVQGIYARLLEADSANPFLLAKLGAAYRAVGQTSKAIRSYRRAIRHNSQSAEMVLQLSTLLLSTDSLEAADRLVAHALEKQPHHPALLGRRGRIALAQRDYEQALTAFHNALVQGDSSAANLRGRGQALFRSGAYKLALQPLRETYRLDSTSARTNYYLGLAEKNIGKTEEALAHLKRAAHLFGQPAVADAYEQIADAHRQQENYPEAIRADRLALRLNPRKKTVLFHLATLYDEYYADRRPALTHYRMFLRRSEAGEFPAMRSYARRRISTLQSTLDEEEFFRSEAVPSSSDSSHWNR